MTQATSKLLTFEEFLSQYGDSDRYELIDYEKRGKLYTHPHFY
jgi:hypothetical protein